MSLKFPVRVITAASLFDGHDASINIIRRMLQDAGCEVIHLGHNRSVKDIVTAALQESAQGICISSYQGGHMEFFKYTKDLLVQAGAPYVKIFGGGGGVIVHEEKKELEAYGIDQIFHPDDGRRLGLDGMIQIIAQACDFDILKAAGFAGSSLPSGSQMQVDRLLGLEISKIEQSAAVQSIAGHSVASQLAAPSAKNYDGGSEMRHSKIPVIGITGTGGAGKSSLVDELIHRFLNHFPNIRIGVFCVDPSKRKTGGALLGDRIRMNSISRSGVFMRSLASRGSGSEVSSSLKSVLEWAKTLSDTKSQTESQGQAQLPFRFDLLIAETSGIGQGNMAVTNFSDLSLYVMTSEFGAQTQLEKIDMIDFADLIAINKSDRRGSLDALRDVKKQYRRSHKLFDPSVSDDGLPVYLTQASHFNDPGVNALFEGLIEGLSKKSQSKVFADRSLGNSTKPQGQANATAQPQSQAPKIIPAERVNYLATVVSAIRNYKKTVNQDAGLATKIQALQKTEEILGSDQKISDRIQKLKKEISSQSLLHLETWDSLQKNYLGSQLKYQIRGREVAQPLTVESLSGLSIPRVAFPKLNDWGDRLRFLALENVPGRFPFTAGVFELKRVEEEPRRQFAGEGTPQRTNRRFHFLSQNDPAKRLSTAFDSVTLYGEDPDLRPDIYGKVGESGVSICTLKDMEILYSGFDLCSPQTSVSMTINGPAPMILAFFLNTAIQQQVEKHEKEQGRKISEYELATIQAKTLQSVRGTVQADILKEDQAQNTCIFSLDFALKMMGDIQEYFIKNQIRNFYSVSISGYHIAEAGANPISQLAFTLSNGFTFVEYYLSRGMKIDDFAPNLSFFFSNGLDPEYTVLGRVARRIWAVAMRDVYGADERSQKLKYHIQTSGRSLHAQEIDFNDIRTTLQAFLAISDNCNSLHTNAYDEAITTPTEESVRRAMAIQMIINREFGLNKNENPLQGSYFVEQLTDLVEEAVLEEFLKINERGGVLGAMETQYQRSRIQDESMVYEHLKHSGKLPIIGVNTFVDPKTLKAGYQAPKIEMARALKEEKDHQLNSVNAWKKDHQIEAAKELEKLRTVALNGGNIFEALMSASRVCSLGQMSHALYEIGGQYRRSV